MVMCVYWEGVAAFCDSPFIRNLKGCTRKSWVTVFGCFGEEAIRLSFIGQSFVWDFC